MFIHKRKKEFTKAKLWRQSKGQWLTEAGEEEVMSRGSTEDVLGQSNYSV